MHFTACIPKGVGDDAPPQGSIEEQWREIRLLCLG